MFGRCKVAGNFAQCSVLCGFGDREEAERFLSEKGALPKGVYLDNFLTQAKRVQWAKLDIISVG